MSASAVRVAFRRALASRSLPTSSSRRRDCQLTLRAVRHRPRAAHVRRFGGEQRGAQATPRLRRSPLRYGGTKADRHLTQWYPNRSAHQLSTSFPRRSEGENCLRPVACRWFSPSSWLPKTRVKSIGKGAAAPDVSAALAGNVFDDHRSSGAPSKDNLWTVGAQTHRALEPARTTKLRPARSSPRPTLRRKGAKRIRGDGPLLSSERDELSIRIVSLFCSRSPTCHPFHPRSTHG